MGQFSCAQRQHLPNHQEERFVLSAGSPVSPPALACLSWVGRVSTCRHQQRTEVAPRWRQLRVLPAERRTQLASALSRTPPPLLLPPPTLPRCNSTWDPQA